MNTEQNYFEHLTNKSKQELAELVIHYRELIFKLNDIEIKKTTTLRNLKKQVYKENSWDSVKNLLNAIS